MLGRGLQQLRQMFYCHVEQKQNREKGGTLRCMWESRECCHVLLVMTEKQMLPVASRVGLACTRRHLLAMDAPARGASAAS